MRGIIGGSLWEGCQCTPGATTLAVNLKRENNSRFPWPQGRVVKVEFYLQGPEKTPLPLRHRQGLLMLPGMSDCFFGR